MKESVLYKLTTTAMFSALCFVGTYVIMIPMPLGYINVGDSFVMLAGWSMGVWGAVGAAIGSALADIISGYVIYTPATFVIKGLVAITAFLVYRALCKVLVRLKGNFLKRFVSAVVAECVMVAGYFLYEALLYDIGTALASAVGSLLQASLSIAIAMCVVTALNHINVFRKYLSLLFVK